MSYTPSQRLWILSCLFFTTFSLFGQTTFHAHLVGHNEALPVLTRATGNVTAVLSNDTLIVTGSFKQLSSPIDTTLAGGAHIHQAYSGQNGGLVVPLILSFPNNLFNGTIESINNTFVLSSEQIAALMRRQFYINVHTLSNPSGEIRGQLLPSADAYFSTNLFGSNEIPSVISGGSGALVMELQGNQLIVSGSFENLEGELATNIAGGAHLHIGLAGRNGGVAFPLTSTNDADLRSGIFEVSNNTFTVDSAQIAALQERRMYANIHSTQFPSGELRGQVISGTAHAVFRAHLSGSNESPVVTSMATGVVQLELMPDSTLIASGTFDGLESNLAVNIAGGAHIHNALAGLNGPVQKVLTSSVDASNRKGSFAASDNVFSLNAAQFDAMYERAMYINIHSEDYITGEIRGQILPEGQSVFTGFISSIFTIPDRFGGGVGALKTELNGNRLVVSGSFRGLGSPVDESIAGGTHIHLGLAGSTGGIAFVLKSTLDATGKSGQFKAIDNRFILDSMQVANFKARKYYVNIHTELNPTGELRGQLLHEANTYFVAPLSGSSESPPINSEGSGMAVLEIHGNQAFVSGSFNDLSTPLNISIAGGAHIHRGLAGQSGDVDFFLISSLNGGEKSGQFEVKNNVFELTPSYIDTLRRRMCYVNVHSEMHPGGELRGQFLPLATQYFTTSLLPTNEVPVVSSTALGALKFEITGNQFVLTGAFQDLSSPFDATIAGGSHLHIGMPGTNGALNLTLDPIIDADELGGVYLAEDHVFELDSTQIAALISGNYYVNIHSQNFTSGELRGQILPETNAFPTGALDIVAPNQGSLMTIAGLSDQPFNISWLLGFDPDGNKMIYHWQLATDPDFNTILTESNTGTQNAIFTDFGIVDGWLEGAGLAVGETITLYHRVISTDGSLRYFGTPSNFSLTRGTVTIIQESDLELELTANKTEYNIWENVVYTAKLTNKGPATATDIKISFPLPNGMVYTSANATNGFYHLFSEIWRVGDLESGESATLNLTLFTLIDGENILAFTQVASFNGTDPDATPGNDINQTPDEDDEAALIIEPVNSTPIGGEISDLETTLTADRDTYQKFDNITYTLTVFNDGPDHADNIAVAVDVPMGTVFSSSNATHGTYNLFSKRWEVGFLESDASATLELTLFAIAADKPLTQFVQVLTADQNDPDSTPNNNTNSVVNEDDEAILVTPVGNSFQLSPINFLDIPQGSETSINVYPNPTTQWLNIVTHSQTEQPTILRIFGVTGRAIFEQEVLLFKGQNQLRIEVADWAKGVYFIKLGAKKTVQVVIGS